MAYHFLKHGSCVAALMQQAALSSNFRKDRKYISEEPSLYNRIKGPIDFVSSEWKKLTVSDEGKQSTLVMRS